MFGTFSSSLRCVDHSNCNEIDLRVFQVFYANIMPLLDNKAITVIFANIEDIMLTNTVCIRIRDNSYPNLSHG